MAHGVLALAALRHVFSVRNHVARHTVHWSSLSQAHYRLLMQRSSPEQFIRRARLSSSAILTAMVLTLAALLAGLATVRQPNSAPAMKASVENSRDISSGQVTSVSLTLAH